MAADPATVVVNGHDIITNLLTAWEATIATAATYAFARFAPPALRVFVTNQMIANSVHYAIGAVEDATKTAVWSIKTSNDVIGVAERFALSRLPSFVRTSDDKVKKLIIAELERLGVLPPDASAGKLRVAPESIEPGAH